MKNMKRVAERIKSSDFNLNTTLRALFLNYTDMLILKIIICLMFMLFAACIVFDWIFGGEPNPTEEEDDHYIK
jgi:hypothetical protein